ncbi:MAG: redoxin domain-containing protein [Chloroflexi bacterium]|nr:redoxin domain-containing protein [Chloroflexota bacterium]
MRFRMRRVTPGVVFLMALLLTIAIACGPSAEQSPATNATEPTAPPEAPLAAAADSAATVEAQAAEQPAATEPAMDSKASESGGTSGEQPTAVSEQPAPADPTATTGSARPAAVTVPISTEIPTIEGIDAWLNTEAELQIGELAAEGKVVLVDFWTYTCINCIRTLPYLRDWWAQYEDDGLVILGIHTPEFEFEKDYQNVADAIDTHSVGWPVAQDNRMTTWRNFENRYWPAKYLYNVRGELIYSHFGEGAYGETEQRIRNALVEAGADLSDDPFNVPQDQARDQAFQAARQSGQGVVTPELYAGWHRNFLTARAGRPPYVAQPEYFEAIEISSDESTAIIDVTAPDVSNPSNLQPHAMYFQGQWSVEPERIRHARATENLEDYLALKYSSKSINAVLTSDSGEPYRVYLTVDGAMMTPENAGADVQWDENGTSYILVDVPRMYALVDNPQYLSDSILVMGSNSDDFGLFAFTFGVYAEGP